MSDNRKIILLRWEDAASVDVWSENKNEAQSTMFATECGILIMEDEDNISV